MASRDAVRGDVGVTERLIEYDADNERVAKAIAALLYTPDELPVLDAPVDFIALLGLQAQILAELRTMNQHLEAITGEHICS